MYDVIIIGRGPAGLSGALYTARANLKTLIIGDDRSSLKKAEKIENYFGFAEPVKGEDLLKNGESQVLRLGVEIIRDEVISIEKKDFYHVMTPNKTYEGKALLLASGQQQKKVKVKNLTEFEGKGVSYCTTCDGFFYNNMKVGVLGHKDFAIHEAIELETYTKDITIFTDGLELELSDAYRSEADRYNINKKPVSKLDGAEFLQRIHFQDGTSEEIDGIFVAYESASSIDFARKLGVIAEENSVVVDKDQQTNLDGFFAAGDCTGGFKQISTAVGQGALAARKIIEYVKSL
ncbi:MAG TPA: NAD(P)/FAD-dependent oxidoreductase [Clostridia bacterium]|nr:NAD(P)/FAD-dependent oxidoreductase [Clostridia bacterium]